MSDRNMKTLLKKTHKKEPVTAKKVSGIDPVITDESRQDEDY